MLNLSFLFVFPVHVERTGIGERQALIQSNEHSSRNRQQGEQKLTETGSIQEHDYFYFVTQRWVPLGR